MQPMESELADAVEVIVIQSEVLEVLQVTEAPIGNVRHGVIGDGQTHGGGGQVLHDVTHESLIPIDAFENLPFGEFVVDAVAVAVAFNEPSSTEKNCDWQKRGTKTRHFLSMLSTRSVDQCFCWFFERKKKNNPLFFFLC